MIPLAPLTRTCSPARTPSASPRTCSAVSAGTGNAAAASQLAPGGFRARSPAGAMSRGAQAPWSRSGSGWVMTWSPGAQSPAARPAATTVPAASTPSAIGGLAPTSQPPVRANSSQLPTPAAITSSSTSSPASGRGPATSISSTRSPAWRIPATCIFTSLGYGTPSGTGGPELARGLPEGLDLQDDLDLLPEQYAAAGDGAVVADAEVHPVDLAGGREPGAGAGGRAGGEGVGAEAVDLRFQRDRQGGARVGAPVRAGGRPGRGCRRRPSRRTPRRPARAGTPHRPGGAGAPR